MKDWEVNVSYDLIQALTRPIRYLDIGVRYLAILRVAVDRCSRLWPP